MFKYPGDEKKNDHFVQYKKLDVELKLKAIALLIKTSTAKTFSEPVKHLR